MGLYGSQMREENGVKYAKDSRSRDAGLACTRGGEKNSRNTTRGQHLCASGGQTSGESQDSTCAHSICHAYPWKRGPRRTSSQEEVSSVLWIHVEFTCNYMQVKKGS